MSLFPDFQAFSELPGLWTTLRCLILVAIFYQIVILPIYNILFHPLRHYPGPKLWAASIAPWTYMFLSGKSHIVLLKLHETYGSIVRLGPNELSFTDPDAWDDIMGHERAGIRRENPKAPWYCSPANQDIIGAAREDHSRMRRLLTNGFSTSTMRQQQSLIVNYVRLLIKQLHQKSKDGKVDVDLHAWFNYCTFDIVGDLVFGESFKCLDEAMWHPWISLIFANIRITAFVLVFTRLPMTLILSPFFISYKLIKQFKEHARLSEAKVDKRLAMEDLRADFIQDMVVGKGNLTVTKKELTNNAIILTLAGSETTATALSGAFYLIAKHPIVEQKMLEELRSSFETEEQIDLLSTAKLPYLGAVIQECLRIYPPGPNAQPRITPAGGNMILGRYIPEKTVLGIPHRAMYLSEKNFHRSKEFLPERWLEHGKGSIFEDDRRDCLKPFSHGPRNCIGMNLAYAELRLILARMVWNFKFELAEKSQAWMNDQHSYLLWQKPALMGYLHPWVRIESS